MKIEVLKEFIKKTVQQEVRNIVQSEIKHQLAEVFSKDISQSKKKSPDSSLELEIMKELESLNESSTQEEQSKPAKKYVKYTNNPMLNDILNQTTGGIPQEGGVVSMLGGYGVGTQEVINETKAPTNAPEPVKSVYSAMNRDYRSLMKAVDKKRVKA